MFTFGVPSETAQLLLDDIVAATQGPPLVKAPFDEASEQELRNALAWANMAIRRAQKDGLDDAVVDVLVEWYDEVFQALLEVSDSFLKRSKQGLLHSPTGPQDRPKYFAFVKAHLES